MAYEGFEALRDEEEALVPLRIVEPADDRQMDITCSVSGSTPSASQTPPPQVKIKRNKKLIQHIPLRETRSKTVKPSGSKSRI